MIRIKTNAPIAAAKLDKLKELVSAEQGLLMRMIGAPLKRSVIERIQSMDRGMWAEVSKWQRAKKGPGYEALDGAERFVVLNTSKNGLTIGGETGKDWALTQHDEGFVNKTQDHAYKGSGDFEIEITNPTALGLMGGTSRFKWHDDSPEVSKTPARKIWDDKGEVMEVVERVANIWLRQMVEKATV